MERLAARNTHMLGRFGTVGTTLAILFAGSVRAEEHRLERFTIAEASGSTSVEGRPLTEAADGGVLVLERNGRIWTATPDRLKARESLDVPFTPVPADELAKQLLDEFGGGFTIVQTEHYVICTNASEGYANWCGSLFERLITAFHDYWSERGLELGRPEFPLPAIVFSNREQFREYSRRELGADQENSVAFYSIASNRIVLYDVTEGSRAGTRNEMFRELRSKRQNVANTVHEATHQIAFNTGFHVRYVDNPVWLCEGLAVFFESPDFNNTSGWRTAGIVHAQRLQHFRQYLRQERPADSVESLVRDDDRFRNPEQAGDAYAEAWALTYYLVKNHPEAYVKYVKCLNERPLMIWASPEERLKAFQACFGDDLADFDRRFRGAISRLR